MTVTLRATCIYRVAAGFRPRKQGRGRGCMQVGPDELDLHKRGMSIWGRRGCIG